jgi:hypothetical protein
VAQQLRRGKSGCLRRLLYPHGLLPSNSRVNPLRQRNRAASDPTSQVTPNNRPESLKASNETWEDVGEMTVLKG